MTRCTFPIADQEEFNTHPCNRPARVTYFIPGMGKLPRCARHDTELVQQEATHRGYTREPIETAA